MINSVVAFGREWEAAGAVARSAGPSLPPETRCSSNYATSVTSSRSCSSLREVDD